MSYDYHPRQTHQHYHSNHRHHWYQVSFMFGNNSWSWTPVSDLSVSVRRTHSIWSHFHFNRRIRNVIANFHCECKSKTNNFSRNVSFKLLFSTSWQKYFFITAVFKTQIQQERFWHLIRNNTISNIQDLGIKKNPSLEFETNCKIYKDCTNQVRVKILVLKRSITRI